MEELDSVLDEIISCIKDSKEYKECLKIKKQMDENSELKELIEQVKVLQKKYIKSNYDSSIKLELDKLEEQLKAIPLYVIYTQTLNKVNDNINIINERLNNYFNELLN